MTCPTFLQKVGQNSVLVTFDTTMPYMVKAGLESMHSTPFVQNFAHFCEPTSHFRDTDVFNYKLEINTILDKFGQSSFISKKELVFIFSLTAYGSFALAHSYFLMDIPLGRLSL